MNPIRALLAAFVVAALAGAACASNTAVPGTEESDKKQIEALEAEAKSFVSTSGCSVSGDCRAAPVGSRGCGGPRYYVAYCAKTTDSAALYRRLDEVAKAEQAYNQKYQVISTCEFRAPPAVESVGGSCVAR